MCQLDNRQAPEGPREEDLLTIWELEREVIDFAAQVERGRVVFSEPEDDNENC
jgi:hypothetical protein